MTDEQRIDWLEQDSTRLEDVRGYCNNEDVSVREAIDALIQLEARGEREPTT